MHNSDKLKHLILSLLKDGEESDKTAHFRHDQDNFITF